MGVGVGESEVPLLAVVSHRPDGQGRYDDAGHDGIHRWREAYDDNRHKPDIRAAARLLFIHAHVLRLSARPRRGWRGNVVRLLLDGRLWSRKRPPSTK